MSFIAQYFEKLNIITVLECRTQAIIQNRFEYKNEEDINCPLQMLVFIQPTTVDNEPEKKRKQISFPMSLSQ